LSGVITRIVKAIFSYQLSVISHRRRQEAKGKSYEELEILLIQNSLSPRA
jgi:hypothetical protein